jgi:hypothetical protein
MILFGHEPGSIVPRMLDKLALRMITGIARRMLVPSQIDHVAPSRTIYRLSTAAAV